MTESYLHSSMAVMLLPDENARSYMLAIFVKKNVPITP